MKKQENKLQSIDIAGKIPPQAIELEEAIISAVINEGGSLDRIIDLKAHHFYKPTNQKIFESIINLYSRNEPIDLLTLTEEMRKANSLDEVGGPYALTEMSFKVASSAHIEFHAQIVKQKYLQRELIRISSEIQNRSFDDSIDIDELIDYANSSLEFATNEVFQDHESITFPQLLKKTLAKLSERAKMYKEGKVTGIPTPILSLTKITGGWQPGELIVIAGRPAMGKTAMVLAIMVAAANYGFSPVLYSLEMDDTGLAGRIIVGESGIDADNFKRGCLDDSEWTKIDNAVSRLYKLGITIDDHAGASMEYIKAKSRILKKKNKCSMILIDYLQLASNEKPNKNREQEISEMSRKAKLMAKELQVPVILLSQLNRGVESRADKKPFLSDLRESGAIEQDADIVGFLYRPEYYGFLEDENGVSIKGRGELIIAKNRNGNVGTVYFGYNESLTKIHDWVDPSEIPGYLKDSMQPNVDF